MSSTLIVEILLALIAAVIGLYTAQAAIRANRQQQTTAEIAAKAATVAVDAQAYVRAKGIYEAALDQVHEDLDSTRRELLNTRDELAHVLAEVGRLRSSNVTLAMSNNRLAVEIEGLRAELAGFQNGPSAA